MHSAKESLSTYLLKAHKINPDSIAQALRVSQLKSCSLAKALIDLKVLNESKLIKILSEYYEIHFLEDYKKIDLAAIQMLPETVIRKYKVLPVRCQNQVLTVAFVDPENMFSQEYVQMVSGYKIESQGILETEFKKFLDSYFAEPEVEMLVKDLAIPEMAMIIEEAEKTEEERPIVKLLDSILSHAVKLMASDVHIEPQDSEFLIRFRIDGILRTIEILPKKIFGALNSRVKVLGGMNITERRIPQDGQIRSNILSRNVDIRISTLPSRYGEKVVLRILDKTGFLLGLDQLGLDPSAQMRLEEILQSSSGMLLVTGPTGSGKTTTLYAAINRLRSPMKNIVTLEDPIEYELLAGKTREGGITQTQINPKVGFDFVEGLRAILRQDPDIIFVGEMRDKESAEIAFSSALTGHFVMSSLHTIGAASTISRLLDMGIEPFLMVSTLRAIVAQRLIRILCSYCKEEYSPPKRVLDNFLSKYSGDVVFFRPKGCPWCNQTGYRGRRGIYEIMEISDGLRDLMLRRASNAEVFAFAQKSGMRTLRQAGMELVFSGETTVAEVLRITPGE